MVEDQCMAAIDLSLQHPQAEPVQVVVEEVEDHPVVLVEGAEAAAAAAAEAAAVAVNMLQ